MKAMTSNFQSERNHALAEAGRVFSRLLREESGQDLIEYALVFSFVALGAIASMKTLGTKIATVFSTIGTTLTSST